jgi:hypothetical protein
MLTIQNKKEIERTCLYDFICNNHWKLSKDDVITLFKEFNYAVYDIDENVEKEAVERMFEEIEFEEVTEE